MKNPTLRPATGRQTAAAANNGISFPASGYHVFGDEYLNQFILSSLTIPKQSVKPRLWPGEKKSRQPATWRSITKYWLWHLIQMPPRQPPQYQKSAPVHKEEVRAAR